jgi:hypothetical protein
MCGSIFRDFHEESRNLNIDIKKKNIRATWKAFKALKKYKK